MRSVDGFLVLLGALVSRLEEEVSTLRLSREDSLRRILACAEVSEALRPLTGYLGVVERLVSTDPRHKALRPYLPLIREHLSRLAPVDRELDIVRPPMSELEGEGAALDPVPLSAAPEPIPIRIKEGASAPEGPEAWTGEVSSPKPEPNARESNGNLAKKGRVSRRRLVASFMVISLVVLVASYAFDVEPVRTLVDVAARLLADALRNVRGGPLTSIDIKRSVLEELNRLRAEHGLPPVKLINLSVAQSRANDMVRHAYYGHCDLSGTPTTYYYTMLGGVYAMEENLGYVGKCSGVIFNSRPEIVYSSDALDYALRILKQMVYDDAISGWGHRDSLLDPTNNYVDIGVDWDREVFVLVLQMNKVWVTWTSPPKYVNGSFKACGRLLLSGSEVTHVLIYRYREGGASSPLINPAVLTRKLTCGTVKPTCMRYSLGTPVAGVVPAPTMYYPNMETVVASKWAQQADRFCIEFTWKPKERGIYTIAIFARNTLGVAHPYDESRYKEFIPVLEYTIAEP